MQHEHSFTVPEGIFRVRADKVLAAGFPAYSRTALQRAFEEGGVLREGVALGQRDPVSSGEVLVFSLPEVRPLGLKAMPIPLEVVYEDEALVAVNKPSGMVVHPGAGTREDTLVHALLAHCAGQLSGIGGVERPGIVHRLDKDTSGLIVAAKTDEAHRELARQFGEREVQKEYLALVGGVPELLSGSIVDAIGRHPVHRHKMAVVPAEKGRSAHTDWERVEVFGSSAALLRCRIHTGRTHQIRVHLSSRRHPLLGDAVYGYRNPEAIAQAPRRVMLHAETLRFRHPVTEEPLRLVAPLAADFQAMLDLLRGLPSQGIRRENSRTEARPRRARGGERHRGQEK